MELVWRVWVCAVGVLVISGHRGDASVDNILLARTTPLLEDNIKSADAKLCHRPCKISVKPKRCHFRLVVEPAQAEDGRTVLAVNGSVPGPALRVCAGDVVVAEVTNRIPDQALALHWRGLEQRGTPYMDGVPMITQCPILFGTTYKYAFRASKPGTFFYHASSVSHQADGVFGALIVSQPAPLEPHASLYDYDRSEEQTLVLAAKFPELLTANLQDPSLITPDALTINGLVDSFQLVVTEGFGYRLRLINAAPVECPVAVSVDSHQLLVIATDGHPVEPVSGSRVLLYPGERMDAVLQAGGGGAARARGRGCWLRARGLGACAGLRAAAPVLYSGYNYTGMLLDNFLDQSPAAASAVGRLQPPQPPPISGQSLRAPAPAPAALAARREYLSIDRNTLHFSDSDNDFRYISDAMPKKPFYPSQLTTREGAAVQINGKSFLFPDAPVLTQPRDVPESARCRLGQEQRHPEPQCLLVLEQRHGAALELVLVNNGAGSNDSYTFNVHGYSMQVLATVQRADLQSLPTPQVQRWDAEGKVERNLMNPPLKDTITVPNKGFVVVRLVLDNKGAWLLECRDCGLGSLPAALLLDIPEHIPKSVTAALPRCGSFRPPDVLLN